MTREEAIKVLSSYDVNGVWADVDGKPYNAEEQAEAFDMAIEALEGVCFDEWCTDCKEYDTEKNCCPRFNKVIRGALNREPSEDGTLEVKVKDATKVGRVLISDDKHRGGLYYPDEDEPKGDLISRAEAIEALGEEPPVWCDEEYEIAERDQWRADIEAIKSVPSADRPTDGDLISRQAAIDALYDKGSSMTAWGELLAMKWSDIQKCIEQLPSADRPRGEWLETAQDYYETVNKKGGGVNENTEYFTDDIACPNCLAKFSNIDNETERFNFCPNCGADMRGDTE